MSTRARRRFAWIRSLEDLQQVLTDRRVLLLLRCWCWAAAARAFHAGLRRLRIEDRNPGLQRDDDGAHWLRVGAGENWHAIVERLIDEMRRALKTWP